MSIQGWKILSYRPQHVGQLAQDGHCRHIRLTHPVLMDLLLTKPSKIEKANLRLVMSWCRNDTPQFSAVPLPPLPPDSPTPLPLSLPALGMELRIRGTKRYYRSRKGQLIYCKQQWDKKLNSNSDNINNKTHKSKKQFTHKTHDKYQSALSQHTMLSPDQKMNASFPGSQRKSPFSPPLQGWYRITLQSTSQRTTA